MPSCRYVEKPSSDTLSWYGPGARLSRVYAPSELVNTVRSCPVSVLVMVTSAPGRVPPLASRTMPDTCEPDTACADESVVESADRQNSITVPTTYRFPMQPRFHKWQ